MKIVGFPISQLLKPQWNNAANHRRTWELTRVWMKYLMLSPNIWVCRFLVCMNIIRECVKNFSHWRNVKNQSLCILILEITSTNTMYLRTHSRRYLWTHWPSHCQMIAALMMNIIWDSSICSNYLRRRAMKYDSTNYIWTVQSFIHRIWESWIGSIYFNRNTLKLCICDKCFIMNPFLRIWYISIGWFIWDYPYHSGLRIDINPSQSSDYFQYCRNVNN